LSLSVNKRRRQQARWAHRKAACLSTRSTSRPTRSSKQPTWRCGRRDLPAEPGRLDKVPRNALFEKEEGKETRDACDDLRAARTERPFGVHLEERPQPISTFARAAMAAEGRLPITVSNQEVMASVTLIDAIKKSATA
jgi:hypothetical protein